MSDILTDSGQKKYTADEFFSMKSEKNEKCELYDGKIMSQAMPSLEHQIIGAELYSIFRDFIKNKNGKCKALPPIDVKLDDYNTVVPDFLLVCDTSKLDSRRCYGAPDFVAEILSSNSENDLITKLALYKKYGVREYWIIVPDERKTVVYKLENSINDMLIYNFDDEVPVGIWDDKCLVDLSVITEKLDFLESLRP